MDRRTNNRVKEANWTHCLIDAIRQFFYGLGWAIGRVPFIFIIITLIVAVGLSAGLRFVSLHNDVRFGYTPDNAPSRHEFAVYREYFGQQEGPFGMAIFIEAKDGGSLLRKDHFDAVYNYRLFVPFDFTISTLDIKNYTYMMSCEPRCKLNIAVGAFKKAIDKQRARIAQGKAPTTDYEIDFPKTNYMNAIVDMSTNFYNVVVNESARNTTGTEMESSNIITLFFLADKGNKSMQEALKKWEISLYHYTNNMNNSYINAYVYGDQTANLEVMRAAKKVVTFFAGGWLLMFMFVLFVVNISSLYYGRMDCLKIVVALFACLTPLLAVGATIGLVSSIGIPVNALMLIMPLLVVAIGLNDGFLMLHSWQRIGRKQGNDYSIEEKTALVFREIAPSMAITSITVAVAYGFGAFCQMPQIRSFCMITSISIAMDFIFQLTLFAPILCWTGRREFEETNPNWPALDNSLNNLLRSYSTFLTTWKARVLLVVIVAACWAGGIYGVIQMKVDFKPHKSFPSDSNLLKASQISAEIVSKQHVTSTFFVNNPPNLSNETEYERFNDMVNELETLPNALGHEYTSLWLGDYANWVLSNSGSWFGDEDETALSYSDVPFFLERSASKLYRTMIKYEYFEFEGRTDVHAFYFYTAYANMTIWADRVERVMQIRRIFAKYPEFNATMWEYESSLYDFSMVAKNGVYRSIIIIMICMAVISVFFIPSLSCILVGALSVGSISVGTLGLLNCWGIDLDPITLLNMMISLGFTVDYTSHIIYHFHSNGLKSSSKANRILSSFYSVSVPMIETCISTLFCVCLLGIYDVYLFVVFAKTILLVACIGLIHGLFIVPTVLALLPDCMTGAQESECKEDEDEYPLKTVERL